MEISEIVGESLEVIKIWEGRKFTIEEMRAITVTLQSMIKAKVDSDVATKIQLTMAERAVQIASTYSPGNTEDLIRGLKGVSKIIKSSKK